MRYLTQYLERYNFSRVHFEKLPAITLENMTLADAEKMADSMVCEFSPENLTCDGELPAHQVRARASLLKNAAYELLQKFPNLQKPQWDDGLFDQPVYSRKNFSVGQRVAINHPRVGGRAVGTVLKVNRVKCRVEFGAGTFNVPMEMMELA